MYTRIFDALSVMHYREFGALLAHKVCINFEFKFLQTFQKLSRKFFSIFYYYNLFRLGYLTMNYQRLAHAGKYLESTTNTLPDIFIFTKI